MKTITRTDFFNDPSAAIELAQEFGSVQLVDGDGTPRGVISAPRGDGSEATCGGCELRQVEIDAMKKRVNALETVLVSNARDTYDACYPLRPALNVLIKNMPRDLTAREVRRLTAFLQSLVIPSDREITYEAATDGLNP